MSVEAKTATVYYAPTKGRRYLSKAAAVRAEARAIIEKHFPSERGCSGVCAGCTYPGCGDPGWRLEEAEPERYMRHYKNLRRALMKRLKEPKP